MTDPAMLVMISAPQLVDGYNLIEVEFTIKGSPLGCRVKTYRLRDGLLSLSRTVHIPLVTADSIAPTDAHSRLLNAVNQHRILYWREAADHTGLGEDDLETIAVELNWRKQLKLDRPSHDRAQWIFRRMY
jgi:hypothetical protein